MASWTRVGSDDVARRRGLVSGGLALACLLLVFDAHALVVSPPMLQAMTWLRTGLFAGAAVTLVGVCVTWVTGTANRGWVRAFLVFLALLALEAGAFAFLDPPAVSSPS